MIHLIAKDTGWTFHYIMNNINWINLQMMMADQIRYKTKTKTQTEQATDDDLRAMAANE